MIQENSVYRTYNMVRTPYCMAQKTESKKIRIPNVYVSVRVPYPDYIQAKDLGVNLSEAARIGLKQAIENQVVKT